MTLIYSRKAYQQDKRFAEVVLDTYKLANSKEHHIELIQKRYPKHKVKPLYTYEHSGLIIEDFKRCRFDSSEDAFAVYLNEDKLNKKLQTINENLNY